MILEKEGQQDEFRICLVFPCCASVHRILCSSVFHLELWLWYVCLCRHHYCYYLLIILLLLLPPDVSNLAKAASTWSRLSLWQNLWNSCKISFWETCWNFTNVLLCNNWEKLVYLLQFVFYYRFWYFPVMIFIEKFESSLSCSFLAYEFSPWQLSVKIFVEFGEHFFNVFPVFH